MIAKEGGGSFGLKNQPWKEEMAVVFAALMLRHPLKRIEGRWDNPGCANPAREQEISVRAAFDAKGRLAVSRADYDLKSGALPHGEDGGVMFNPAVVEGQIAGGLAQVIGSARP